MYGDNQEAVAKATASFIYKRFDKSEFEMETKLVYRRGRRPRRPAANAPKRDKYCFGSRADGRDDVGIIPYG